MRSEVLWPSNSASGLAEFEGTLEEQSHTNREGKKKFGDRDVLTVWIRGDSFFSSAFDLEVQLPTPLAGR